MTWKPMWFPWMAGVTRSRFPLAVGSDGSLDGGGFDRFLRGGEGPDLVRGNDGGDFGKIERSQELTAFEALDQGSATGPGAASRANILTDEQSRSEHGGDLRTWRTMIGGPGRPPP